MFLRNSAIIGLLVEGTDGMILRFRQTCQRETRNIQNPDDTRSALPINPRTFDVSGPDAPVVSFKAIGGVLVRLCVRACEQETE